MARNLACLQPPAQQQRTDRAADLQGRAGQRRRLWRHMRRAHQRRRPADQEEITHQVAGEHQPGERRDRGQPVAEQIDRAARRLLLVLDDEARVGRHREIGADFLKQRYDRAAVALVQRHELDRFRQAVERGQREYDRRNAADVEQDLPAVSKAPGPRLAKPASAPPSGTMPVAMIASVARMLRGANSALIATILGMTPPMPSPATKRSQRQFGEIGRIGGPMQVARTPNKQIGRGSARSCGRSGRRSSRKSASRTAPQSRRR